MLVSPHFTTVKESADWDECFDAPAVSDPLLSHHEIEQAIWRELQSIPGVHFSSLTVRRVRDGVCLQGVMEPEEDIALDICDLVRHIVPVDNVMNQLLVRESGCCTARLPR